MNAKSWSHLVVHAKSSAYKSNHFTFANKFICCHIGFVETNIISWNELPMPLIDGTFNWKSPLPCNQFWKLLLLNLPYCLVSLTIILTCYWYASTAIICIPLIYHNPIKLHLYLQCVTSPRSTLHLQLLCLCCIYNKVTPWNHNLPLYPYFTITTGW